MMLALSLMFILVFLLNQTEGFRERRHRAKIDQTTIDTVEAIAIGLVCPALILFLLQELTPETSFRESLGKIIFKSVPFTLCKGTALLCPYGCTSRLLENAIAI